MWCMRLRAKTDCICSPKTSCLLSPHSQFQYSGLSTWVSRGRCVSLAVFLNGQVMWKKKIKTVYALPAATVQPSHEGYSFLSQAIRFRVFSLFMHLTCWMKQLRVARKTKRHKVFRYRLFKKWNTLMTAQDACIPTPCQIPEKLPVDLQGKQSLHLRKRELCSALSTHKIVNNAYKLISWIWYQRRKKSREFLQIQERASFWSEIILKAHVFTYFLSKSASGIKHNLVRPVSKTVSF